MIRQRARKWARLLTFRSTSLAKRPCVVAKGDDADGRRTVWVPDERKRILVDNAERLYGFERV